MVPVGVFADSVTVKVTEFPAVTVLVEAVNAAIPETDAVTVTELLALPEAAL
jgi:hypothetical protein